MDILALFGRHLRTIRKERLLTQETLAQHCELYPPYIGELERGEKNPTLLTLEKLTRGLNISLTELVAIPKLEKNSSGKIIGLISEAGPKKQKKILKAVKLMVD